jgi:hypothetical protein
MNYPIWNIVTSCIYKADKSYGVRETGEVEVRIGTGAGNSFEFVKHYTTHRKMDDGSREYRFYVDGKCLKTATVNNSIMSKTIINNQLG